MQQLETFLLDVQQPSQFYTCQLKFLLAIPKKPRIPPTPGKISLQADPPQ